MDYLTIIIIALGLAMDAFAVSIASGVGLKNFQIKHALWVGILFGGFQALMPVLGWLAGSTFSQYISSFDHWIAFGLLAFIGGKMVYESFVFEEAETKKEPQSLLILLTLAVATSIDALAVGLSFSLLSISIVQPVIIIGLITFAMSFGGVFLGNRFGSIFENKIEIVGGIILIGMGIKILVQHLV